MKDEVLPTVMEPELCPCWETDKADVFDEVGAIARETKVPYMAAMYVHIRLSERQ